ncbi:hypothetical protein DPX16_18504 [Anabarilius grahami]|uniref:Uncharacterized protein n=1 Tax=Anabarilius grahami TaxID=495550 RepID=A0A3N0YIQ8_ANAGA|nr:hypothetical protein DPX16_18504 [Anabarilius grahami]
MRLLLEGGSDMSSSPPVFLQLVCRFAQTGLKPESLRQVETNNQPISSPADNRRIKGVHLASESMEVTHAALQHLQFDA